jgi:hypothetical protein
MDMMSKILAIVALAGFAIQQLLELLSPFVSLKIRKRIAGRTATNAALSEAELKKWWMAFLALLLGVGTVAVTKISLLKFVEPSWECSLGDFLVTALVLSAGTEGLNTLTKYFGYVKEGRKAAVAPQVEVAIVPSSVTVQHGQTFQFRSVVKNTSNAAVTWEVAHGSGGSIDLASGLYTAPNQAGTYNVLAVSKADEAKHAVATVKVT